jgi:hypothetical protein
MASADDKPSSSVLARIPLAVALVACALVCFPLGAILLLRDSSTGIPMRAKLLVLAVVYCIEVLVFLRINSGRV